jgi:hypothetical protein
LSFFTPLPMSGPPRPSPAVVVAESRGISWVMHSWRLLVSDTYMMFQSPVIFRSRLGDISANDRLRDHENMQCNPRGLCWDFSGRGLIGCDQGCVEFSRHPKSAGKQWERLPRSKLLTTRFSIGTVLHVPGKYTCTEFRVPNRVL